MRLRSAGTASSRRPAVVANAAPAASKVTFCRNIAPIVYRECAPCHRPGESAPFSLLTYDDVKRRASQIADLTKRRYMPPWQKRPRPQLHGFKGSERRLHFSDRSPIMVLILEGPYALERCFLIWSCGDRKSTRLN